MAKVAFDFAKRHPHVVVQEERLPSRVPDAQCVTPVAVFLT